MLTQDFKVVASTQGAAMGNAAITHVLYGDQDKTLCDSVHVNDSVVMIGRVVNCKTCSEKLSTIRKQKHAAAMAQASANHCKVIEGALGNKRSEVGAAFRHEIGTALGFTPMKARFTYVYLARSGGFDVSACPDAERLAQFIADSCNTVVRSDDEKLLEAMRHRATQFRDEGQNVASSCMNQACAFFAEYLNLKKGK